MQLKEISSLQHPLVKHWVQLSSSSSYRQSEKTLLVTGENVLVELAHAYPFKRLIMQKDAVLPSVLSCEEIYIVSEEILKKISGLVQPGPLAAELPIPPAADLHRAKRLLVLDQITDPGNLGTLLRSALALGWDGVFLLDNSVDPFNDKALRAAKGATFRLRLAKGDEDALAELMTSKEWTIYGADLQGSSVCEKTSCPSSLMLILGNEAHGLSHFSKERSTLLSLPTGANMQSLNVAVAGSILMFILREKG